jgi:hypothetical protein
MFLRNTIFCGFAQDDVPLFGYRYIYDVRADQIYSGPFYL